MSSLIHQISRLKLKQNLWYITLGLVLLAVLSFLVEFLYIKQNSFYFFYKQNILGLSLFYSGIICGILVFLFSDVRLFFNKSLNAGLLVIFLISIWLFINETNLLNLFIIYELFLLPSFYLVYRLSPNRRSIIAAIYFLTWTQFGSLLVLIGIVLLFWVNGGMHFDNSISQQSYMIFWLFFIGFGIKIPMWPFYYWLTKTHVEASSFFSMYLSGFLVKTAVFLFIKFYSILSLYYTLDLFIILFIIGIIDSSIKMWHQTDLKKLIAYTTVQEMNFLCIPILWNDLFGEILVSLFIATHCLLSCIFFFFIDVITKRFNTRVTSQITGLSHTMPTFAFLIFISWILFSGLPYTLKFFLEIGIFSILFQYNFYLSIVTLIIMNILGIIGFTKNIFNVLFGAPIIHEFIVYDLTKREFLMFSFLILNLIILNSASLILL